MRGQRENVLAIEAFAARVRLSQRQLERQFKTHLKTTPVKFYLKLRLDYARSMVTQTNLSMIEIAVACGFTSQEHFSRSYRKALALLHLLTGRSHAFRSSCAITNRVKRLFFEMAKNSINVENNHVTGVKYTSL